MTLFSPTSIPTTASSNSSLSATRSLWARMGRMAGLSLVAFQGAIATAVMTEAVALQPHSPMAQVALAQTTAPSVDEAVVYIETDNGRGSGVIIESDGLIVTNAHVIEGARQVYVKIRGNLVTADVVRQGASNCLDLALLRISGYSNLPTVELGNISDVSRRDPIFAIGYPGGLPSTSSSSVQGIISNIHPQEGMIQLDAAINPGNSGGAIVNQDMELVGIATSGLANREGIKFGVSVDRIRLFLEAYRQNISFPMGAWIIPSTHVDMVTNQLFLDGTLMSNHLGRDDHRLCSDFSAADIYTFDAEAGQGAMIKLNSDVMGTYAFLFDPQGNLLSQTGSEERDRSTILLDQLPVTGTYTLIANSYTPDETGPYQLRATTPMLIESGSIDRSTRPCTDDGILCETYYFDARANQTITIAHTVDFVPQFVILAPDGSLVDNGTVEPNGLFNVNLPMDGWYSLVIGPANAGDRGNFTISVHDSKDLDIATIQEEETTASIAQ